MSKNTSKTGVVKVNANHPALADDSRTPKQEAQLKKLESIIKQHLEDGLEAAAALQVIRDEKLFRPEYKTFGDYCDKVWDYSRNYCNRLCKLNEVMEDLKKLPDAENALPRNEAQARIYADLDSSKRITLLRKALEKSPNETPTSKLLIEWKKQLFTENGETTPRKEPADAEGKLKSTLKGKTLVKQYNKVKEIYEMCVDNSEEDEFTDLLKAFIDEYKSKLDPEAVKAVEEEKAAKEAEEEAA